MKATPPFKLMAFNNPIVPLKELSTSLSSDEIFLYKIRTCVLVNLEKKHFSAENLAQEMFLSVSQLNRRLNSLIGRPSGQLIRELRLRIAAKMLADNSNSISEVAHQCGYCDQAHFSRSFKKRFHCTPTQYRKQYHKVNLSSFFKFS